MMQFTDSRDGAARRLEAARAQDPYAVLIMGEQTGGSRYDGAQFTWRICHISIECAARWGRQAALLGNPRDRAEGEDPLTPEAAAAWEAAYDRFPEGEAYCPHQHLDGRARLSDHGIVPVAGDRASGVCPDHRERFLP